MKYVLFNTEREIVLKRANGRSTFEDIRDAYDALSGYGSHIEVRGLTETDRELDKAGSRELSEADPK